MSCCISNTVPELKLSAFSYDCFCEGLVAWLEGAQAVAWVSFYYRLPFPSQSPATRLLPMSEHRNLLPCQNKAEVSLPGHKALWVQE